MRVLLPARLRVHLPLILACLALAILALALPGRPDRSASAGSQPRERPNAKTLLTATATVTQAPSTTPSATATVVQPLYCSGAWNVESSPDTELDRDWLHAVHAVSPSDIWAVGESASYDVRISRPLIQHYDGGDWTTVPGTVIPGDYFSLSGVSGATSNTVWAVGTYSSTGAIRPLMLRWDGATWSQVQGLDPNSGRLIDVDAVSDSDAWVVGENAMGVDIRHWDGTQWVSVSTGVTGTLQAVDVLAPDDVWAVGSTSQSLNGGTLTMHWDGAQWTVVPSPAPGPGGNNLLAVEAISANDVWAVGYYYPDASSYEFDTLAMHWDGSQWSVVPTPNFARWNTLEGLAALAPEDVWAVGSARLTTDSDPVALHWNGSVWVRFHTVEPKPYSYLDGITAPRDGELVAVGATGGLYEPLIERYASVDFLDVPTEHTFYSYVRCLACRSIVQGYPDGSFRPNEPVTRAQVAKIVLLSTGIDPFAQFQAFADVPPGHPFYNYIEPMASRGWMSGYPCGGPGEPCDSENRPYFRPYSGGTRGQLTKIVSNAAGFDDTIPDTQHTFADAPPNSTFRLYIERLLLNRPGVMEGYPCGGPGEPCDPENRPYFRPNNQLTRGQTAKITVNTLLPGCEMLRP